MYTALIGQRAIGPLPLPVRLLVTVHKQKLFSQMSGIPLMQKLNVSMRKRLTLMPGQAYGRTTAAAPAASSGS